jgi:hypothetical protein
MQFVKSVGLLVVAAILVVIALALYKVSPNLRPVAPGPVITNFDECAAAGNPIMESYPAQCRTEDGRLFVQEIVNQPGEGIVANGCAVAGCSGQLCVSADEAENLVTTCEFRAEYACYREASCEPQADGKCGWTETAELKQCLTNPPPMEEGLEVM